MIYLIRIFEKEVKNPIYKSFPSILPSTLRDPPYESSF